VLDGVRVVRTCHFKDLLEVVFGWLGSPLEITFGHCHELLAGVVDFLPAIVVAGHCSEVTRSMFLPLFPALSTLSPTFDGGLGGHRLATVGARSHITQGEGGPNSLLTRGVSGYNVEQLLGSF
jgi:hypothetical protein